MSQFIEFVEDRPGHDQALRLRIMTKIKTINLATSVRSGLDGVLETTIKMVFRTSMNS